MHNETLAIFDEAGNRVGTAPRDEVHRVGYWHETFHCWFVSRIQGIPYIYFQLRSNQKQDYPGLLDITAAGHLLANETVEDGIREVQEELGVELSFEELIPLGTIPYHMENDALIDNERAHVFLYSSSFGVNDFSLQKEEVAGIALAKLEDFRKLCLEEINSLQVSGFQIDPNGQRVTIEERVNLDHFVPHELEYYTRILDGIEAMLKAETI